jgi:hypothetical protein
VAFCCGRCGSTGVFADTFVRAHIETLRQGGGVPAIGRDWTT